VEGMTYPQQFWNMLHEANNERYAIGQKEMTPEEYYPIWKSMVLIETGSNDKNDMEILDE
jgi:hypothetical protein